MTRAIAQVESLVKICCLFFVWNSSVSGFFFSGIPSLVAAVWDAGGCQEDRETNERMNFSCSRSMAWHVSNQWEPLLRSWNPKEKALCKTPGIGHSIIL